MLRLLVYLWDFLGGGGWGDYLIYILKVQNLFLQGSGVCGEQNTKHLFLPFLFLLLQSQIAYNLIEMDSRQVFLSLKKKGVHCYKYGMSCKLIFCYLQCLNLILLEDYYPQRTVLFLITVEGKHGLIGYENSHQSSQNHYLFLWNFFLDPL